MKNGLTALVLAATLGMISCTDDEKINGTIITESEFDNTSENWEGGFAEYETATDTASLEMRFRRTYLPAVVDSTRFGLLMQSHNRSDDMFMFVTKKMSGLRPNANYQVTFDITMATPFSDKGIGAGGSGGGSTYLKAGATTHEPVISLTGGRYLINIDKGNQSQEGKEMVILGNIANGLDKDGYTLINRSNKGKPVSVVTDSKGEIWLTVGTDSGFEGLTTLYYDRIKASMVLQD